MLVFLSRRLAYAALTAWIAVTIAFFALRLLPGDAIAAQLIRSGATESQIAARREALGLDRPPFVQYLNMLGGLLQGDLGQSLSSGRAVSEMLGEQFGATLTLAASAIGVGLVIGLALGIAAAVGRWRVLRIGAALLATVLISSPVYWTGTFAIYLFSVALRWLPSTGSGPDARFLILPSLVLGLAVSGAIARLTAASLADVRDAEFVRTARAKGLRERRVIGVHMLRAALGPVITLTALQFAYLLGGAVVTEMLFVRRGIGQVVLTAVNEQDYPVVQGIVALSAILYSLVSAAADIGAAFIDPRVRRG